MKVSICDICIHKNRIRYAGYRLRLKSSRISVGLDLCEQDKNYGKDLTVDEVMKKYVKLEQTPKPILRMDLLFKENLK